MLGVMRSLSEITMQANPGFLVIYLAISEWLGKVDMSFAPSFTNTMLGLHMNSSLDSGDIEWRLNFLNTCIQYQGLMHIGTSVT
jgi:hypothetical protein